MEKTTKYLRCHSGNIDITVGKRYEVVDTADCQGVECYVIIDDAGDRNHWPIEIDDEGESYRDWFTLETDADSAAITILPDESLGGTLREYREVKRKANVGETVIMTEATGITMRYGREVPDYHNGDIFVIKSVSGRLATSASGKLFYHREYSVLEPTDILRIDGERFRMVERKAAVGERVIITTGNCAFSVGEIITVHKDARIRDTGISYLNGSYGTYGGGEYRVLEPLTSAELSPAPTPLSELSLADQYAENITVLTRKIAELDKIVASIYAWHRRAAIDLRVAREDIVLIEEGVSGEIKAIERRLLALETDSAPAVVKVAEGPVDKSERAALPSYVKTPKEAVLSPQQIRDEIVERAKADVKLLEACYGGRVCGNGLSFWPDACAKYGYAPVHNVEYVVNAQKRTVVALIRYKSGELCYRGIAKCAPGDVFNSALGKAIALRRALGLEVTAEYLTCPMPTEIRVGDVVLWTNSYDAADTQVFTIASVVSGGYRFTDGNWDSAETVRVINDSREDGGISASPSSLKGAA